VKKLIFQNLDEEFIMQLRTSETIPFTDIQRRAREIFEQIETGEQEKYVILKNNEIAAVLLPIDRYEALMDELEDLRIDALARERLATFDPGAAISHADMLARFNAEETLEAQ
jgi:antitoxin StbD